jgi:acyl dehydratase
VFGGLTASGAHTVALQIKLVHQSESREDAVLAVLGWDEVRFPKPVRPGDTLSLRNECIETRASESKPDRGIARMRVELLNQHGETVLTSIHTILVARRRD